MLAFDVGQRRIGVARAVVPPRIAQALLTLANDDQLTKHLQQLMAENQPQQLVVGRPRNQMGERTAQTQLVEEWAAHYLEPFELPIAWQDESLTSVQAEQYLEASRKPYSKAAVDMKAAELILQDYLEELPE